VCVHVSVFVSGLSVCIYVCVCVCVCACASTAVFNAAIKADVRVYS